jgi:hypothetical protein
MSKAGHSFIPKEVAILVFVLMLASTATLAKAQQPSNSTPDNSLREFIRHYLGEPDAPSEKEGSTHYSGVFVDLNDDGKKEVIVYVSGRMWCGTGGCVMLILALDGESYRVVTRTTVTKLPIRVLTTKSNGWHDISVAVAGEAIQPGYEAELSFDGKTYPSNPTVPPARRLSGKAQGGTVITDSTKDRALY